MSRSDSEHIIWLAHNGLKWPSLPMAMLMPKHWLHHSPLVSTQGFNRFWYSQDVGDLPKGIIGLRATPCPEFGVRCLHRGHVLLYTWSQWKSSWIKAYIGIPTSRSYRLRISHEPSLTNHFWGHIFSHWDGAYGIETIKHMTLYCIIATSIHTGWWLGMRLINICMLANKVKHLSYHMRQCHGIRLI